MRFSARIESCTRPPEWMETVAERRTGDGRDGFRRSPQEGDLLRKLWGVEIGRALVVVPRFWHERRTRMKRFPRRWIASGEALARRFLDRIELRRFVVASLRRSVGHVASFDGGLPNI